MAKYHQVTKNLNDYVTSVLNAITPNMYPERRFVIRDDREKAMTSLAETADTPRLCDFDKAFYRPVKPNFYRGSGFNGKELTFSLKIKYPRIGDWGIAAQDDFAEIQHYVMDNQPIAEGVQAVTISDSSRLESYATENYFMIDVTIKAIVEYQAAN
jgi:hypothetical protein